MRNLQLNISRNAFTFISKNRLDFIGFQCDKFVKVGDEWHCIIRIQKKLVLGVKTLNVSLPKLEEIKFNGYGLITKLLINEKMIDHIEIGGPINTTLIIQYPLLARKPKRGTIKIAAPPTNKHQKLIDLNPEVPGEIKQDKNENTFLEVEIPENALKKGITVGYDAKIELRGLSSYHYCQENDCKINKAREDNELVTKLTRNHPDIAKLIEEVREETHLINIMKRIYSFLNQHLEYRTNYQRYGAIYALQTGHAACDEISDLVVMVLKSVGINSRFVKGFFIKEDLTLEGHAWVEIEVNGEWLPFDPTAKLFGVGMRWIKLLAETKKGDEIIQVYEGVSYKKPLIQIS